MLSSRKVNVLEAEQLLQARTQPSNDAKVEPRYFRILVNKPPRDGRESRDGQRPRADHGGSRRPQVERLTVEVDGGDAQVRIRCE